MTTTGGGPGRGDELIKHSKRNRTASLVAGQNVLLKYSQERGRFELKLQSSLLSPSALLS